MADEDHSDNDEEGRRPFKSGEQGGGGGDKELTSLSWLQGTNLLKDFRMGGGSGDKGEGSSSGDSPEDTVEHVIIKEEVEECDGGEQNVEPVGGAHTPYDPTLHAHSKPPYSFPTLILMAIEASPRKALPLKDIYGWILERFPYFQGAPSGWKNSVRHYLSLTKCFKKVKKEKGQNVGNGSLWCIDQEIRPNLLRGFRLLRQ